MRRDEYGLAEWREHMANAGNGTCVDCARAGTPLRVTVTDQKPRCETCWFAVMLAPEPRRAHWFVALFTRRWKVVHR